MSLRIVMRARVAKNAGASVVRRLVYAHKASDRSTGHRAIHRADERRQSLHRSDHRIDVLPCRGIPVCRIHAGAAHGRSAFAIHRPRFMRINVAARYGVMPMPIGSMARLPSCISGLGE